MRWVQRQTWNDLLFLHWPVPAEALRRAVPGGLDIEERDGTAWLGVTPFVVSGARPRGVPPLPWLSRFPETNVRTYVAPPGGRPGIWFLSLDAARLAAVIGARAGYRLPYFHAAMDVARRGHEVAYRMRRRGGEAALAVRYRPVGPVFRAAPGSVEHFLVERYRLYAADRRGRLLYADIDHPDWPLQPAEAVVEENTMAAPWGISLPGEPLAHYAARQDVVIGPPRRYSAR
jgi:uncharacterized protein YqjF (DUF2071 family)